LRQPVHRNGIPILDGIGYVYRLDSNSRPPLAVVYYFPLFWTTSFSSDISILSRV